MQQSGGHDEAFYQEIRAALNRSGHWQGDIGNRRKNGEVYPAWQNINAVKGHRGHLVNYVSVFSDISKIKEAGERLNHLAHHDALTGLLQVIAERLKGSVRAADMVARLGSDEFTIVLEEISHAEDAAALAEKIIRAVASPVPLVGHETVTSTSVGISIHPDDAASAKDLAMAAPGIGTVVAREVHRDRRGQRTHSAGRQQAGAFRSMIHHHP